MLADVVAVPVLERLSAGARTGVVRGATPDAAYLDFAGFVVALTAPGVALMPNGVAVPRTAVSDGPVRAAPGMIEVAGDRVTWDPADPPRWEPALRRASPDERGALGARGTAMLDALGVAGGRWVDGGLATTVDKRGAEGTRHLHRALSDRDADEAARAAERLIGLGAGLTPEGDDVLTAVAAVVAATGDAVGFDGAERRRWLAALAPIDCRDRTTALAATLLGLGAEDGSLRPCTRCSTPPMRGGEMRSCA